MRAGGGERGGEGGASCLFKPAPEHEGVGEKVRVAAGDLLVLLAVARDSEALANAAQLPLDRAVNGVRLSEHKMSDSDN